MSQPRDQARPSPTAIGQRILAFMTANYVTDIDEFAIGILGITPETFRSWIYTEIDARALPAAPILICAEALNTSPDYIIGLSDDPRPGVALSYDEYVVLQCFRDTTPEGREQLSKIAWDMAARHPGQSSASSPFAHVHRRPLGPANEGA